MPFRCNLILQNSLPFLILLVLFSNLSYSQRSDYSIPRKPWSLNSIDIELDGDIDLVIGHKVPWLGTKPALTIMKNIESGNFIYSDTSKSYTGYQEDIVICKLDNNVFPDMVTFYSDFSSGLAERNLRVWYNESGLFNEYRDFGLNSSAIFSGLDHGDINGDNKEDILVLSNNDQIWGVLYGNIDGTLSDPEYFNVPEYYPVDITSGDLNGDGREDVVVCGQDLDIYYSFQAGFQRITFQNAAKSMVDIIDFDGDEYLDLITAADLSLINLTSLVIYKNQADSSLEALPENCFTPGSSEFCLRDFNNDNLPDVAFLSYFPYSNGTDLRDSVGGIYILYNMGSFNVSPPTFISLKNESELYRHFHSSDFDGNGFNDFAIVRTFYDTIQGDLEILFNDGKGYFISNPFDYISSNNSVDACNLIAFPNQIQGNFNIRFQLNRTSEVEVTIYDFQGRSTLCYKNENVPKGVHSLTFNNNCIDILSKPGYYILRLKSNNNEIPLKIIKL